ncbi:MAG: S-methyl-5-thioribose-1-phosphate isomerase [Desulfobulbus propionicus]|nr:MAG: S-methyl-5-thioribose-1-phosphate isomerase [Desulfobulbus propionicus]
MLVDGIHRRTIWLADDGRQVEIIDQTRLPHEFTVCRLSCLADAVRAIRDMQVRGAPLIGATAAYGICLGLLEGAETQQMAAIAATILACRPTAVNLRWAVERMMTVLRDVPEDERVDVAYREAAAICEEDVRTCEALGVHGMALIRDAWQQKGQSGPVQILTHCNAGWLAAVDWGTALAPVYKAAAAGIPVHVLVDETRPRNQGAHLTAWELGAAGISHHLLADNSGGHLMRRQQVDLCIVGTDRTAANGDVCNKIGTYLKALAARDNNIPFYVALPASTIDWTMPSGADIPIEEREQDEVLFVQGLDASGAVARIRIAPQATPALNPAFDVTPARLVTALITERGICPASRAGLASLYPERQP